MSHPALRLTASAAAMMVIATAAATPASDPWTPYLAELTRQCPAKHLEWLAPAELREALDHYETQVDAGTRGAMAHAEAKSCRNVMAGATCGNAGDLGVAETRSLLQPLVATVCGDFSSCREQSDCNAAANATRR